MKKEMYLHIRTGSGTSTVAGANWEPGRTAVPLARAQYATRSQDVARAADMSAIIAAPTIQAVAVESK